MGRENVRSAASRTDTASSRMAKPCHASFFGLSPPSPAAACGHQGGNANAGMGWPSIPKSSVSRSANTMSDGVPSSPCQHSIRTRPRVVDLAPPGPPHLQSRILQLIGYRLQLGPVWPGGIKVAGTLSPSLSIDMSTSVSTSTSVSAAASWALPCLQRGIRHQSPDEEASKLQSARGRGTGHPNAQTNRTGHGWR